MTCQAYQSSDQMICGTCVLQWDINDPEPPKCKNRKVKGLAKQWEKREAPATVVTPETITMPIHVTAAQAFEIARVYETQRAFGRDMTTAMQKAYESFVATV